MKGLGPPGIDYPNLYATAIGQTQKNVDRAILKGLANKMIEAGKDYDAKLKAEGPHAVAKLSFSEREQKLVEALYEKRLVSKQGSCRSTYEKVLGSATHCPYCEWGEVYEVDHFLPQGLYPCLNIYPANLVPICHPCNHIKLTLQPKGKGKYLVHPYFDVLPGDRWLFAKLEPFEGGVVIRYWVDLEAAQYGDLAERLGFHFLALELDRRMRERSSKLLIELRGTVDKLLATIGVDQVQAHFAGEASKEFGFHGNTLEAAAYQAASEDVAFCSGAYAP